MGTSAVHKIRHIQNDKFFIQCGDSLIDKNGVQVATITSIDTIRLEKRTAGSDPQTWSVAVEFDNFNSLQLLNDPSSGLTADMIAGRISIGDESPMPAAGDRYFFVAECTITFVAAYGSGTSPKDFARRVEIVSSFETAPVP